ncbi:hypothetical protein P152DRAFT_504395 [Eremomyces bilateralis CBS 781.70]|uniref:Dihydrolipoamide acetyltransferase component of pyruvate dehydrogenase complex n=1 Tax=Eremomyces bilateralis CBS 781.70 TaxID=1392243 RepID=A0A6G1GG80_9PEZI|nr:uncharacterized protein P152DRAFT_504395 [Eremomyces bilateralis CBS 781.70]KAF1816936.1 hypothetical protein P152DRAFT_504395 [Eremomyces bilateralis CBS 781.70]
MASRTSNIAYSVLRRSRQPLSQLRTTGIPKTAAPGACQPSERHLFHGSSRQYVVKPYLLADIGEGITECQIIQWFVQPGARVEQFDKICEVQSDKASVEITSRFDGIIKKLHYEADDMAKVGKPLVDIDIQSEVSPEDEALTQVPGETDTAAKEPPQSQEPSRASLQPTPTENGAVGSSTASRPMDSRKHATLATPAVRHLSKEFKVDISEIEGSGREGRVTKDDIQKFIAARDSASPSDTVGATRTAPVGVLAEDKTVPLSMIQQQMFKVMTNSLSIPHFLYTDHVDFTGLTQLRRKLNTSTTSQKITPLAFIVKAVSLALTSFPQLNAHLDTTSNPSRPSLIHKASHNIGVAVDTPSGLLVPVIRNVQTQSIATIAAEISRLSAVAKEGKLSANDLSGATMTVSNIGSIGGGAVAPVIVGPQVAILGVGRARVTPAFGENGELVRKEEAVFSWSGDHRVIDGAVIARCAEEVRSLLEGAEKMLVRLR